MRIRFYRLRFKGEGCNYCHGQKLYRAGEGPYMELINCSICDDGKKVADTTIPVVAQNYTFHVSKTPPGSAGLTMQHFHFPAAGPDFDIKPTGGTE